MSGSPSSNSIIRRATTVVAIAAGAWLLFFALVTLILPNPIEYREGASQVVTQLLLAGQNPFSIQNQPLGMTNYGIVFSLVAWPLADVFGNTLLVHRIITVACLGLSGYLVWRTTRALGASMALGAVAAEIMVAALATRGGLGGYPSALGALFFLAAITTPYLRRFDGLGLVLSGAASLLALYTKPYFVLGFGIVATYTFLFVSKKSGLLYAFGFGISAALSVLAVQGLLPMYFYDTVFNNLANSAVPDWSHLGAQLRQSIVEFLPLVVGALIILLAGAARLVQARTRGNRGSGSEGFSARVRGAILPPMEYFAYASICALTAFVLVLGPHPENYMNYVYQLVVPVFVLWILATLRRLPQLHAVVVSLMLVNLAVFSVTRLAPSQLMQTAESAHAWDVINEYAGTCQRPLNSPIMVSRLILRGVMPIDTGHIEYFFNAQPLSGMEWLSPGYDQIAELGGSFISSLRASVAHGEFDCIVLARHSAWPRNLPLARGGYALAKSVVIEMPQTDQTWQMDIWLSGR